MPFEINDSFEPQVALPVDKWSIAADATVRDAIPDGVRYLGMKVFVQDEGVTYVLKSGLTDGDWELDSNPDNATGPAASVDNEIPVFDGITGKAFKQSGLTFDPLTARFDLPVLTEFGFNKQTRFYSNIMFASLTDNALGSNQTLSAPTTKYVRLTGALISLDMIPAGQSGQELVLVNTTASAMLINNETGGTAANRIRTGTGGPVVLKPSAAFSFVYDLTLSRWVLIGGAGGGSTDLDILFQDDFESSSLSDYTHVGLTLSSTTPLHGLVSAVLTHDSVTPQTMKRTYSVEEKFRNKNMTVKLTVKSGANAGDVLLKVRDETNAADIVVAEALQFASTSGGATCFVTYNMPSTCASVSYTITASPRAGSPVTRIDDIVMYVTDFAKNTALIQEQDFELKAAGNAAQAITANVTNIPFIATSVKGSSASWNGSQLTIIDAGIYSIRGTFASSTNVGARAFLYVNGVEIKVISSDTVTDNNHGFDVLEYFNAGDVVSIRSGDAQTLLNNTKFHWLTVTRQGSLKQIATNPNSKFKIPTSELRFEGSSGRGSTDTYVVKFDSQSLIKGDAFSVVNTATNGTVITIKKAGRLAISASLYYASSAYTRISRNQVTLTSLPLASEMLAASGAAAANIGGATWVGEVAVNDVIRIITDVSPASNNANNLYLSHHETEVQISVSNTLPQFTQGDSFVSVNTANGTGSTYTSIPRFSNNPSNTGTDIAYIDSAANGASFTVNSDGLYHMTFNYGSPVGGQQRIGITRNLVLASKGSSTVDSLTPADGLIAINSNAPDSGDVNTQNAAVTYYLNKGDVIRGHLQTTSTPASVGHSMFHIAKVGKPNLTGLDVTQWVNVPRSERQSIQLRERAGFGSTNTAIPYFTNTDKNSGDLLLAVDNSSTLGLSFRALKKIKFRGVFTGSGPNGTVYWGWTKNSSQLSTAISSVTEADVVGESSANLNGGALSVPTMVELLPGDIIRPHTSGSGAYGGSDVVANWKIQVDAEAISDQIITPSETFSTDTAALTYAGSGTYTLATLANAPVGTFITGTYAANSNTLSQTNAAAPTQTTSNMSANGIYLAGRAYNAASTSGNPTWVAVQIGKGLKGVSCFGFLSTGSSGVLSYDRFLVASSNAETGITFAYNDATGVAILNAGENYSSSTTTRYIGVNLETANSYTTAGYFKIHASKTPAFIGFNPYYTNQNIEIAGSSYGMVQTSPDGSRWRMGVSNAGATTWTKL